MQFEFDPEKSAKNKAKHGIDFVEAQALWQDEDGIRLTVKSLSDAVRFARLACLPSTGKHWAAIFTERGEAIRLISVRRARDDEKEFYEQNKRKS